MVPFLLVKGDTVLFAYYQVDLPVVIYRAASTMDWSVSIPGYCATTYLLFFALDLPLGSCVDDDKTSKLDANMDSGSESLPSSNGVSERVAALEDL
jgi:hypothetical protein